MNLNLMSITKIQTVTLHNKSILHFVIVTYNKMTLTLPCLGIALNPNKFSPRIMTNRLCISCIVLYSPITLGFVGAPLNVFNSVSLDKYQPGGAHPLSRQRQAWSSHLAQGCYVVSQQAVPRLESTTCAFGVHCAIHFATTSP